MARTLMPAGLALLARNQFHNLRKVGQIEIPKLFVHGSDDPTVPIAMGRKLFEKAADPKEWYEVPRAGHNDLYQPGGYRYRWRVQRFLRGCVS